MAFYNKLVIGNEKCTVFLYGEIGEVAGAVGSNEIVSDLLDACETGKPIEVRINSNGGDVFAGIAIFNALRNCKGSVKIFVDGVAASMASVIALCGKHVEMSRYARLMIHRVSGVCYGNADDLQRCIDELDGIEETLCQMYAPKLGKTAEEIRASYFDGRDHWITAQEALELGLINGIYDTDTVPAGTRPEDVYNTFNRRFKATATDGAEENGDLSAFTARLGRLLGLTPPYTTESVYKAVKRLIRGKEQQDGKEQIENAVKRGWIDSGQRSMFAALAKSNRQAFNQYMSDKQRGDNVAVEGLLDKAESSGQIFPQERSTYKAIGGVMGAKVLAELVATRPGTRRIMRELNMHKENRNDWTLADWRTYAPEELRKNPKLYDTLRKKEGGEPLTHSLEWYRRNNPDFLRDNPDFYKQLVEQEFSSNK